MNWLCVSTPPGLGLWPNTRTPELLPRETGFSSKASGRSRASQSRGVGYCWVLAAFEIEQIEVQRPQWRRKLAVVIGFDHNQVI